MKIQDFTDMTMFEKIMSNWAKATGLATVAIDANGNYISGNYNFTDFCMKYTRASKEGGRRCAECDLAAKGVYHCHAGLIDFSIDLLVNGEKLGAILGGQVLPFEPTEEDEKEFRRVAREIGVDENKYIAALHKVNIRSEEAINASAELLGQVLNNFINEQYATNTNSVVINKLTTGVKKTNELVDSVMEKTNELKKIQARQKILALNASIESARAGDAGRGFAVVADEVSKLSERSSIVNTEIVNLVNSISDVVSDMNMKK